MAEDTPVTPPADPEPEGAVDVQGQKMVPLAALTAERERVRAAEREKVTKEYEPLKTKAEQADRLAADLQAVQPYIESLRANPELMKPKPQPEFEGITDEEAERTARQYELFTPTGLDVQRAKRIIADRRKEMRQVAAEVAQETVRPAQEGMALQQSRQNFITAAQARGQNGQPLVDPKVLAQVWSQLPAELTATAQVADFALNTAIGLMHRSGVAPPQAPQHEPLF